MKNRLTTMVRAHRWLVAAAALPAALATAAPATADPPVPMNCEFDRGTTTCVEPVGFRSELVHTPRSCSIRGSFGFSFPGHIHEVVDVFSYRTTEYRGLGNEHNISHLPVLATSEREERIVRAQFCASGFPHA